MNTILNYLKRNKFKILFISILGVGLVVGWSIYRSYHTLKISFATNEQGVKASVYRVVADNSESGADLAITTKNLVREVDQTTTLRLKNGSYVVATSGNNDYKKQLVSVTLRNGSQTVTIAPEFTDTKLQSLLSAQKNEIQTAILRDEPIAKSYIIGDGRLYKNGEWYGTTLFPKVSEEIKRKTFQDTFRLVAHKENGVWKVVTLPPELLLTTKTYPDIPRDILVDTNKLEVK